jgi:hypothetical protein
MLCIKHVEKFLFHMVSLHACWWILCHLWQSCSHDIEHWCFMCCNIHVERFIFLLFCVQPHFYIGHDLSYVLPLWVHWCCIQQVEKLLFLLVGMHNHLW